MMSISNIILSQIDTLGCQQNEMGHKDKSMIHALYKLWYAKGICQAEAMSNSKPISLVIIELRLFEGIS